MSLSADVAHFVDELVSRTRMAPEVAAAWVATVTGLDATRADHNYAGVPGETYPSARHAARRAAALVNDQSPEIRNAGAAGPTAQLAAIGAAPWTPATADDLHANLARLRVGPERTRRRREANLSIEQIARAATGAGLVDTDRLVTAVAIALAESGGNPRAHATGGEDSRGLWQINVRAHPHWANRDLYDPATNAAAMMEISGGGTNWRPWSVYKNGRYRAHVPRVRDALATGSAPVSGGIGAVLAGGALGVAGDNLIEDPAGLAAGAALGPIAAFFGLDNIAAQYFTLVLTSLFVLGGIALIALGMFRLTGTDPKAALAKGSAIATGAAMGGPAGAAAATVI